jgi:hypothetical protein
VISDKSPATSLSEASPDINCYWSGTAPFCSGQCFSGQVECNTSSCGDGHCCWTGHKKYCCYGTTCPSRPLSKASDVSAWSLLIIFYLSVTKLVRSWSGPVVVPVWSSVVRRCTVDLSQSIYELEFCVVQLLDMWNRWDYDYESEDTVNVVLF